MTKYFLLLLVVLGTAASLTAQQSLVTNFQLRITPQDSIYFQANDSVLNPFSLLSASDTVTIGISALAISSLDSVHIDLSDSSETVFWSETLSDFQGFPATSSGYMLLDPALYTTFYSPFVSCTAQFFSGEQSITIHRIFNNQQ